MKDGIMEEVQGSKLIQILERIAEALEKTNEILKAKKTRKIRGEIANPPEIKGKELATQKPEQNEKIARLKNANSAIVISCYAMAFKERYKVRPDISGKTQGLIKNLLRDVQVGRLCDLVQAYLQMEDPWFKTKCHDFVTFYENIGKVGIALDKGVSDPTKKGWMEIHEETYGRKEDNKDG